MGKQNAPLLSFNRGEVSKKSLARVDVERMRLSAEEQINWQPWVLGPMMLRPGLQYCGGINDDLTCRLLPFIFANTDLALLECTDSVLRVWNVVDDTETLVTRPAVTSVVTNGDFSSSSGWTLTATGSGAASSIGSGVLSMASPSTGGLAQAKRSVSIVETGVEHAFRIVVTRGPVLFRCGTTDGDDDIIAETFLDTGVHSLAFTTAVATVYIQLENREAQTRIVDSITFEAAGVMELPTTWVEADLSLLRYDQSGDVVFVACAGQQQRRIERRSTRSWSYVLYKSDDGPFAAGNGTDITMTPSVLTGNGTLTASRNVFRPEHVGALFRLFSSGQTVTASLSAQNTFTDAIRVTGVDAARILNYAITGTWVGTLTFQRSFDSATSGFADVTTFTANASGTSDDSLDNSITWYRIGFKTGAYTSGTASITLSYAGGSDSGVCRVVGYTSRTVVDIEVLDAFSSLTATTDWAEGDWSDQLGWPSTLKFHDGRLFQAGRDKIWGSVSDAYTSYDPDYEGDAGPINRSVGFGPVDTINWLLDLSRLIVGREGAETSVRSGSLDEPLTPTNFTLKDCSTQGSAPISAVKIDKSGVFVQQSNRRVYMLGFSSDAQDYRASDLTRLNPDIGLEGFVDLAVQRQPDTQLHFIRGDGQSAILLSDAEDDVMAWWRISTTGASGEIESVCVLPGSLENRVYYAVKRTIGGGTKRFLEKLARRDQCDGRPESRCADSHVIYSGAATTTITGLSHLNGESVVVWGYTTGDTSGKDLGTFTVASGQITGLAETVTDACIGLSYSATFRSSKLAYAASLGSALTQEKKVNRIGLILSDTHYQGVEFGQDFDTMDDLPLVEDGEATATNTVWEDFDGPMTTVPGSWDTDSRLCLRATAPRPCMVMAAVVDVTTND